MTQFKVPYRFCDAMLGVHLHHCHDVDFTKPLTTYIRKQYGPEYLEKYATDIRRLNELRKAAGRVSEPSIESRNLLSRYNSTLESIKEQLPINPSEISIPFSWSCSFIPRNKFTSNYIEAEQAAVLYNLAAAWSHAAMNIPKKSTENLKSAIQHYCTAAGIFAHCKSIILATPQLGPLVPDLTSDCLTLMQTLMLAQAQECFVEYAKLSNIASDPLLKLMMCAGKMYEKVVSLSKAPSIASVIDQSWILRAYSKSVLFSAVVHQVLAHQCETKMEYGEQVARLRLASKLLNGAFNKVPNIGQLLPSLEMAKKVVDNELRAAEKANSEIYFMTVKAERELTLPPEHCMVDTKEMCKVEGDSLFVGLLSKSDMALLDEMTKLAGTVVNEICEKYEEVTSAGQEAMKEMGLPGAVTVTLSPEHFPLALKRAITSAIPTAEKVLEKEGNVDQNKKQCLLMISDNLSTLNEIDRAENELQQRFGQQYQNQQIRQGLANLLAEARRLKGVSEQAETSDNKIKAKLNSYRRYIELIKEGPEVVEKSVPAIVGKEASGELEASANVLKQDMEKIADIFEARRKGIEEAKKAATAENVSKHFRQGEGFIRSMIEEKVTHLDDTIDQQADIMAEMRKHFREFEMLKPKEDESTRQREEVISEYEDCLKMLKELEANLAEGEQFYSKLMNKLIDLTDNVTGFKQMRHLQVNELLSFMQSQYTQSYGAPPPNY
ncbi:hypothetical protein P9112_006803 [Eukaryota sp. TZLM1-RC]